MGLWRCENCGDGTPPNGGGPEWRWAGDRMQHKCSGLDPQAGHFDCRWFGNGNGHPGNYSRDSSAMLAAIAANPDEDMPRLAYADWLDENTNRQVDLSCSNCNGRGKHKRGYCDAFMYSCGELGVDDGDCPHMKELVSCGVCRSTGVITTNPDHDRAELIRLQCRLPLLRTHDHTDLMRIWRREAVSQSMPVCALCNEAVDAYSRERELIAAHPEWTQWPCPECEGVGRINYGLADGDCEACNGTGDLIKDRRVTWDRGWPGWVHVERVSELVIDRGTDEYGYRHTDPTPLLAALTKIPPWGVPLRGVIVEELEPHAWHAPVRYGWLVDSVHCGRSAIPDSVFRCIKGGNSRRTPRDATLSLAAAFLTFGRKHS